MRVKRLRRLDDGDPPPEELRAEPAGERRGAEERDALETAGVLVCARHPRSSRGEAMAKSPLSA